MRTRLEIPPLDQKQLEHLIIALNSLADALLELKYQGEDPQWPSPEDFYALLDEMHWHQETNEE